MPIGLVGSGGLHQAYRYPVAWRFALWVVACPIYIWCNGGNSSKTAVIGLRLTAVENGVNGVKILDLLF